MEKNAEESIKNMGKDMFFMTFKLQEKDYTSDFQELDSGAENVVRSSVYIQKESLLIQELHLTCFFPLL